MNCIFWNSLENVKMILKPLNKVQRQSELDSANIRFVILRLIKTKEELECLYKTGNFLQEVLIIGLEKNLIQRFK